MRKRLLKAPEGAVSWAVIFAAEETAMPVPKRSFDTFTPAKG
jgi:hypothetical protein